VASGGSGAKGVAEIVRNGLNIAGLAIVVLALGLAAYVAFAPSGTIHAQMPPGAAGGAMPPMGGLSAAAPAPGGAAPPSGTEVKTEEGSDYRVSGGTTGIPPAPIYINREGTRSAMEAELSRLGAQAMASVPSIYRERLRQDDYIATARANAQEVYSAQIAEACARQAEALGNGDQATATQYAAIAAWLTQERQRMQSGTPTELTSPYYGTHKWFYRSAPSSPPTDQSRTRRIFQQAHLGSGGTAAGQGGMMGGMMGPGMMGGGPGMMGAAGGSGGPGAMGPMGGTGPGGGRMGSGPGMMGPGMMGGRR